MLKYIFLNNCVKYIFLNNCVLTTVFLITVMHFSNVSSTRSVGCIILMSINIIS